MSRQEHWNASRDATRPKATLCERTLSLCILQTDSSPVSIRNRHLLTSIFALLFWDILWDEDVPGAFEYCYQDGPLDLYEPGVFLRSRERQICELLKDIGDGEGAVVVDRNLRGPSDGSAKPMTVGWDHISYSPDDPATLMKVVQVCRGHYLVVHPTDRYL